MLNSKEEYENLSHAIFSFVYEDGQMVNRYKLEVVEKLVDMIKQDPEESEAIAIPFTSPI